MRMENICKFSSDIHVHDSGAIYVKECTKSDVHSSHVLLAYSLCCWGSRGVLFLSLSRKDLTFALASVLQVSKNVGIRVSIHAQYPSKETHHSSTHYCE